MTIGTKLTTLRLVAQTECQFTLLGLSRACRVDRAQLVAWVDAGVLTPSASAEDDWRFGLDSLPRVRRAQRLSRDLALDPAGVALVLDLLDRIDTLTALLQRPGARSS